MWRRAEGRGMCWVGEGRTVDCGGVPLDPSCGALAGDAVCATGMIRRIEAVKQIRGEAENQVEECRTALAHAQWGLCAQKNLVFILGDRR